MSLQPYTEKEVKNIIKSIVKCVKTHDMKHLTKAAYHYIYLCSGFIAHYNIHGFRDYYMDFIGEGNDYFERDLRYFQRSNQWDNFRPGEKDYEYYHQKGVMYNEIISQIS